MDNKHPRPIDVAVGARVRAARSLRNLSQSTLADSIGVTFQQVQKYEHGVNRISASRLVEMAESLGVPPGELLSNLTAASAATIDFSLFTRPGVMELVQANMRLAPREQRALLQLARALGDGDDAPPSP